MNITSSTTVFGLTKSAPPSYSYANQWTKYQSQHLLSLPKQQQFSTAQLRKVTSTTERTTTEAETTTNQETSTTEKATTTEEATTNQQTTTSEITTTWSTTYSPSLVCPEPNGNFEIPGNCTELHVFLQLH